MTSRNKTVLITGAGGGIGAEFAKRFYSRGYKLALAGRSMEKMEQLKRGITEEQESITIFKSDLSADNAGQELFEQCKAAGLTIDILVNNSGVGIFGEHTDLNTDEVEKMIALNIVSLTTLCRLFGAEMKEKRAGHILNVSSTAAYQPVPYFAAYAATKSYVLNFSEALAKELEDYNVVVSCLSPGHTATNFFEEAGIGNKAEGFFTTKGRMDAGVVAEMGINALFAKKLSIIPGLKNKIIAFSNRLVSRKMATGITKGLTKKG